MTAEMTPQHAQPGPVLFTPYKGLNVHEDRIQRTDHIAVISAGYKNEKGTPVASRDGTIYISDPEKRAPGLAAILAKNGGKRLTIAMPSNNPRDFISESFRREGKSRLEVFGDAEQLTYIAPDGTRRHALAGTEEYEKARKTCKVATSISFLLAEYDDAGAPRIIWPDGMGVYRLRTTSPNTRDNLMAQLTRIASLTGGLIAGIPLEVTIVQRQMAGPDGTKRSAPVFAFTLNPPNTIKLDAANFKRIASVAVAELSSTQLVLPPPVETLALAEAEVGLDRDLRGGDLDEADIRARWFSFTKGTHLDGAQARAAFIGRYTADSAHPTTSLKDFLAHATAEEAEDLLSAALQEIEDAKGVNRETGEVITPEVLPPEGDEPPLPAAPIADEWLEGEE